jgi:hypothetical protein
MINAIISGKKTQTRRIIKYSKNIKNSKIGFSAFTPPKHFDVWGEHESGEYGCSFFPMKYVVGDKLWVRETFDPTGCIGSVLYKADYSEKEINDAAKGVFKWKPSIFMPKEHCRIWLKVSSVQVQRLQEITEKEAIKEGIEQIDHNCFKDYLNTEKAFIEDPISSFKSLWISINGEKSWNDNPFVWVISFELVELRLTNQAMDKRGIAIAKDSDKVSFDEVFNLINGAIVRKLYINGKEQKL